MTTFAPSTYSTIFNFRRPGFPLTVKGMTLEVGDVNITDPFIDALNGEITSGIVNALAADDLVDDDWLTLPMLDTPVVFEGLSIRGPYRRSEFASDEEYEAANYGKKNIHYGLIAIRMTNVVSDEAQAIAPPEVPFRGRLAGQGPVNPGTPARGEKEVGLWNPCWV